MEENSNKEKESTHVRDRFKMDPPENAWNLLDAELERKQATIYRQRGNRFKMLSIGLALLLVSFVTYYYLFPVQHPATSIATDSGSNSSVNVDKKENSNNLLTGADSKIGVSPPHTVPVAKGGLGPRNSGRFPTVPRSSSLHNNTRSTADESAALAKVTDRMSQSNDKKQNAKSDNENNINGSAESDNASKVSASAGNDEDNVLKTQTTAAKGSADEGNPKEANPSLPTLGNNVQNQNATDNKLTASFAVNADSGKNSAADISLLNKDKSKLSRWSIDVFYSPNYYSTNHLVNNNAVYSNYSNEYSSDEKPQYTYAAGLGFRYDLTSRWSVSAGGTYSTIAYSMTLPTIYAKYGSDDQLHYQYPTSCGNIEMPNPTGATIHYKDSLNLSAACNQVVKIISVPVTVRFQIAKNSFIFYTDAGLSANFIIQEKANINIGNRQYTIVNNIDGLKKMNYGYLLGVGVEYGLYNNIAIFMEPTFRGSLNSLTQNTSFYCYPVSLGLNMGISYHF